MYLAKRFSVVLACIFMAALMGGCGDSDDGQIELSEAERKLEEAQQLLDQAKSQLDQAKAERSEQSEPAGPVEVIDPVPLPYAPPPDHIEPFDMSFGFGNPEEVTHFWKWVQKWDFTDDRAVNKQKPGGAILASRYRLVGDFQITVKGRLTQSWSNSKKSFFEICGQKIGLANWKATRIELSIKREGSQLTYIHNGKDPVVLELNEEQAGPAQARLVAYGRYATINQFTLVADSADRITE